MRRSGPAWRTIAGATALTALTALTACTSIEPRAPEGSAPPSVPTDDADRIRGLEVPPRLTTRFEDARPAAVPMLTDLSLTEAELAPSVRDSPIDEAVLVVQRELFSPARDAGATAGMPFVLAEDGSWRVLRPEDYGIDPLYANEWPVTLSTDGTRLVMTDRAPARVVVLDLPTGAARSWRLPRSYPAGVHLSPSGRHLMWFDRNDPDRSFLTDLEARTTDPADFDAIDASFLGHPAGAPLVVQASPAEGRLVFFDGTGAVGQQALDRPDLAARGVTATGDHVLWQRRDRVNRAAPARIVAADPETGMVVGQLYAERARSIWLQPVGSDDRGDVLLSDWSSGTIYRWSVERRAVSAIGGLNEAKLIVTMARLGVSGT